MLSPGSGVWVPQAIPHQPCAGFRRPGDRDMGSVLEGHEVSTDRRALEPVLGALNVLP